MSDKRNQKAIDLVRSFLKEKKLADFEELFKICYPRVRAFLRARSANQLTREELEDLCQDVMLVAMQRLTTLREPTAFWSWLIQIARHRLLNHLARRPTVITPPGDMFPSKGKNQEEELYDHQMNEKIRRCFDQLSPRRRAVIILSDVHEMKNREIASLLGTATGTVGATLHAARRALRECLQSMDGNP